MTKFHVHVLDQFSTYGKAPSAQAQHAQSDSTGLPVGLHNNTLLRTGSRYFK